MKTAVEFLLRELENKFSNEMQNIYSKNMQLVANICEQAKEMEKEQIIDAYNQGHNDYESKCYSPEQYYNETFKSE